MLISHSVLVSCAARSAVFERMSVMSAGAVAKRRPSGGCKIVAGGADSQVVLPGRQPAQWETETALRIADDSQGD